MSWARAGATLREPSQMGAQVAGGIRQFGGSQATPGFGNSSTWHPTVAWLLGFCVVEIIAYHILSHFLNI